MNRWGRQTHSNAAVGVQKVYRGHLGRKIAKKWAMRRQEIDGQRALFCVAALTIQRFYRGYWARLHSGEMRKELVAFIFDLRLKEAQENEEALWQTHAGARKIQTQSSARMETRSSSTCMIS
jgi:hypothetical protein